MRIKEFKFLSRDGVDTVENEGVDFGVEETDFILNSKEASDDDACSEQCETSCSSSYSAFSNK